MASFFQGNKKKLKFVVVVVVAPRNLNRPSVSGCWAFSSGPCYPFSTSAVWLQCQISSVPIIGGNLMTVSHRSVCPSWGFAHCLCWLSDRFDRWCRPLFSTSCHKTQSLNRSWLEFTCVSRRVSCPPLSHALQPAPGIFIFKIWKKNFKKNETNRWPNCDYAKIPFIIDKVTNSSASTYPTSYSAGSKYANHQMLIVRVAT